MSGVTETELPGERWAVRYRRYGGPDICGLEREPVPAPGKGQLLVRTAAVSVNPVDWKLVRGDFRIATGLRPNRIPGSDFAGEVVLCGDGVSKFKEGDRVFGMISALSSGTYAEYILVPEAVTVPVPQAMSYSDAAALPLTSLTAFQTLFVVGRIAPGSHVLINGASGGVGVAALQLAKIGRARVTAVAGPKNRALCTSLGADHFIDYHEHNPLLSRLDDFDLILDAANSLDPTAALEAVGTGGNFVTLIPGAKPMLSSLLSRRKTRRHRVHLVKADGPQLARIADHVKSGRMKAVVEEVLPVSEFQTAWQRSMDGHVAGKLVLDTREAFSLS